MFSERIVPYILIILLIIFAYYRFKEQRRSFIFWRKERERKKTIKIALEKSEVARLIKLKQTNEARRPSKDLDYVNKNTESLKDFLVTDDISEHDLRHLYFLNQRDFYIKKGWYPLILELIKDLDRIAWSRKISFCYENGEIEISIPESGQNYIELLRKYQKKLENTCEECGEHGEHRYLNGVESVACYTHYTIDRGWVLLDNDTGFTVSHEAERVFLWTDIADAFLLSYEFSETVFAIEFTISTNSSEEIRQTTMVRVLTSCRGFGSFVQNIPAGFPSFNYNFSEKEIGPVGTCPTCGYQALYIQCCECCETTNYTKYDHKELFSKTEYLKDAQMEWHREKGEETQEENPFYKKISAIEPLYTSREFEEYLKHWNEDD